MAKGDGWVYGCRVVLDESVDEVESNLCGEPAELFATVREARYPRVCWEHWKSFDEDEQARYAGTSPVQLAALDAVKKAPPAAMTARGVDWILDSVGTLRRIETFEQAKPRMHQLDGLTLRAVIRGWERMDEVTLAAPAGLAAQLVELLDLHAAVFGYEERARDTDAALAEMARREDEGDG